MKLGIGLAVDDWRAALLASREQGIE